MKSKTVKLISGVAVLAVLSGTYIGVTSYVDSQEEKEAESDCKKMMELIFDIYNGQIKGQHLNVVLNDETVLEMQKKVNGNRVSGFPLW